MPYAPSEDLDKMTQNADSTKDLLQSVFDNSAIGMSVLHAIRDASNQIIDFKIMFVNRELQKETGRKDLVGKSYLEEYPGIEAVGILPLLHKVMETGKPEQLEYHYAFEGFDKWYSSMFVKIDNGILATSSDISEKKASESNIVNLQQEKSDIEDRYDELTAKGDQKIFQTMLITQEKERKRIGESLHNGLGQMLYGVKLSLEKLNFNTVPLDLEQLKEDKLNTDRLLVETIRESRRLSHELMPTILEDFGLKDAVQDICRQFSGSLKIKFEVMGVYGRLNEHIEIAVFRIIQELLLNVVKHSKATEAKVKIQKIKKDLVISVKDNGIGFDTKKINAGMGLKTIKNKVKMLNGNFSLSSASNKPCKIDILIPL
jgi:signal transduction histidine kinase